MDNLRKQEKKWIKAREYSQEILDVARIVLEEIKAGKTVDEAVKQNPLPQGGHIAKHALVTAYRGMIESGEWDPDQDLLSKIRMKPVRTLSGVTTVTILTKPYPCPGKCIFCPTDERMPKSYLPDEPGAMRALHHEFDPYEQVTARLEALNAVGHPTDKIELLILGGTWSSYTKDYQEWFIKRCFEALNKKEAKSLKEAHHENETSTHRNVGLVIETRPDKINSDEIIRMRRLGVTKVQLGIQSLNNEILELNQRGHTREESIEAFRLLRLAGIKIVAHWMPNLFGSNLIKDQEDFARIWKYLSPDEIKIYPNQLLANTELYQYWLRGEFRTYSLKELIKLIADLKPTIPRYCRVNRIVRDIPSTHVVAGNRRTSLRQDVQKELKLRGTQCQCVRCREVRELEIDPERLIFNDLVYPTVSGEEHFISFDTHDDRIAGFLRLSLPKENAVRQGSTDLKDSAIIREVHVYGQSIEVGKNAIGSAQHIGLGTELINRSEIIAMENGYKRLAVISAIGTHQYYLKRGFERGELYLVKELDNKV